MAGRTERDRESSARGREIGDRLKGVRVKAGFTAQGLAGLLGVSPSKVSRMESGFRGASELDVTMYLATCRAPREEIMALLELVREHDDGYRVRPHREQLPDELSSLIVQENLASSIIAFEPQIVPGILQTEDYARSVFQCGGLIDESGIRLRIEARLARQKLLRRPDSPRFTFFLQEHALRSMVGDMRIMHEQVMHLVLSSSLERCEIRVIPRSTCPAGIFGGSFRIMRYDEHRPVVYVENLTASLFLEDRDDLLVYRDVVRRVADMALDAGQSREWLATLASDYDRVEDAAQ